MTSEEEVTDLWADTAYRLNRAKTPLAPFGKIFKHTSPLLKNKEGIKKSPLFPL
jgi:hypothetical protein